MSADARPASKDGASSACPEGASSSPHSPRTGASPNVASRSAADGDPSNAPPVRSSSSAVDKRAPSGVEDPVADTSAHGLREVRDVSNALGARITAVAPVVRGHLPAVLKVRPYDPHGLKPIPSRVLCEEDYVGILESIIQRDFFPDLHKLRLQKALLDARRQGDTFSALQLQRELRRIEAAAPHDLCPSRRVKLLDGRELDVRVADLSLQQFQALFTSEDNASFEKIVVEEKKRLSQEQAWIETAALRHNALNAETTRAIEAGERPPHLVTANVVARNALMFPLTDANAGTLEVQKLASGETVALYLGEGPQTSRTSAGVLVPENTRLEEGGAPLMAQLHEAAIAKQEASEHAAQEESLFDAMVEKGVYSAVELMRRQRQDPKRFLPPGRAGGAPQPPAAVATPLRRDVETGQAFPFLTIPVFKPGENMSPLMTWGTVAATPLVLSGTSGEEVPTRFTIPDPSPKELAAMRLADSAAKRTQEQKAKQNTCLRNLLTPLLSVRSRDLFASTPSRASLLRGRTTATPQSVIRRPPPTFRTPRSRSPVSRPTAERKEPERHPPAAGQEPSLSTDNLLNF